MLDPYSHFDLMTTDFGVATSPSVPPGGGGERPARPCETPRPWGARGVVAGSWYSVSKDPKGRSMSVQTPMGDLLWISLLILTYNGIITYVMNL